MALELLSKKVSCKYKHNSLRETLSCLLNPFPPSTSPHQTHTPNTRIPCHPHQMRTWVFFLRVQNGRDPYTRGHFSSVHRKGEKRLFFFFFAPRRRVPSLRYATLRHVFYTSVLTLEDAPPTPLPTSPQLPSAKKKKKRRPTQHATTHPAECIQICLPKEGKKRRRK